MNISLETLLALAALVAITAVLGMAWRAMLVGMIVAAALKLFFLWVWPRLS